MQQPSALRVSLKSPEVSLLSPLTETFRVTTPGPAGALASRSSAVARGNRYTARNCDVEASHCDCAPSASAVSPTRHTTSISVLLLVYPPLKKSLAVCVTASTPD